MPSSDNTTSPLFKRCTKCECEYPATDEYFRPVTNHGKPGLRANCRSCERLSKRNYDKRKRPWELADRKAYMKAYGQTERYKTYRKEYWQRPDVKARAAVRLKKLNQTVERKAKRKAWSKTPEGLASIKSGSQRRRAIKKSTPSSFTSIDYQICMEYWHYRCAYCDSLMGILRETRLTLDHFIPLNNKAECTGTVVTNMVPCCGSCNCSKQDRDPVEWLTTRFGARKAKQILKRIEAYFASLKDDDS